MNFKKEIKKLTDAQIKLARLIEKKKLASFTQAVRAIANRDPIVEEWKKQIKKENSHEENKS